jgi:hypothetical protein
MVTTTNFSSYKMTKATKADSGIKAKWRLRLKKSQVITTQGDMMLMLMRPALSVLPF